MEICRWHPSRMPGPQGVTAEESCCSSFYAWRWVRGGSLWGSGLVLGPVDGFFVGVTLGSLKWQKPATQHGQPARQLPFHLLPEGGGDVSWGLQAARAFGIGCSHLQHWLALQRTWKVRVITVKEESTLPSLSLGQTNPRTPCSHWKTFSSDPSAESQGHFSGYKIKYQLKNDSHAFSAFRQ